MNLYEIIMRLNGKIHPIGEINTDWQRLENLKSLIDLLDKLLIEIADVAKEQNRSEFSIQQAGKLASNFIADILANFEEDNQLVLREPVDIEYRCLYLNGKPFFGWKSLDDPSTLMAKLGEIGKYSFSIGEPLTYEEYESTWC